jgi:hypothetical protein
MILASRNENDMTHIAFGIAVVIAAFGQFGNKKVSGQEFTGSIEIAKDPKAIWAVLTDGIKQAQALGFEQRGGSKKLEKIGDSSQVFIKAFNDAGTFTVTYVKPMTELRLMFEPENGTYVCSDRWLLEPAGKGTKLTHRQLYTESGPQTAAEIQSQIKTLNEALAKLKSTIEGK